ncbi:MAG: polyisoprenoid-binding protein [Gemmatimonadetes bacterium]|nr:MAG: polyisoprenoid-binding protein [Gemmatimonadota bacterium]
MKHIFAFATLIAFVFSGVTFAADTYTIDPAHSHIGFAVKHMVISKTKGEFKEYESTLIWDDTDPSKSSVKTTIQVASIDTDEPKRDEHLRSADFLDAETYPTITFVSKQIKKQGKGYLAIGDLTIRDVTKEVEIPFEVLGKLTDPWGNTRIGISGGLTINRQDYGVSWSKTLDNGGLVVGDEVEIELTAEYIMAQDDAGK